ncbi:MAG: ribonuclease P protein component [Methylococcales bacterium]
MTQKYQCFPRYRRLCCQADFQYVFRSPFKVSTRYFTILYRSNGMTHARLGLAISKKTIRKAIDRNRFKRYIRESFRLNQQNLGSFDIVVFVKKELIAAPNAVVLVKHQMLWNALLKV